jgi:hypothetical protein
MVHTLCNRKSKSRPSSIDVLCREAKSFASTSSEQDAQGEIRESAPGSLKSCDVVDLFVALRYEMAWFRTVSLTIAIGIEQDASCKLD